MTYLSLATMSQSIVLMCALPFLFICSASAIGSENQRTNLCPDAASIHPCVCSLGEPFSHLPAIDCSAADEEELASVFADIHPNEFSHLSMYQNTHIKTLRNTIFGNATFESVQITDSAISEVEEFAFHGSSNVLKGIRISSCLLTSIEPGIIYMI